MFVRSSHCYSGGGYPYRLPVVPHKVIAEVSKIGNLVCWASAMAKAIQSEAEKRWNLTGLLTDNDSVTDNDELTDD